MTYLLHLHSNRLAGLRRFERGGPQNVGRLHLIGIRGDFEIWRRHKRRHRASLRAGDLYRHRAVEESNERNCTDDHVGETQSRFHAGNPVGATVCSVDVRAGSDEPEHVPGRPIFLDGLSGWCPVSGHLCLVASRKGKSEDRDEQQWEKSSHKARGVDYDQVRRLSGFPHKSLSKEETSCISHRNRAERPETSR